MKITLWGDSASQMSEREKKRMIKFIRSNLQDPKAEIEFVLPSEQDIKKANTKSKRGGVEGGTGRDADTEEAE